MKFRTIDGVDLRGKYVLLRDEVHFNPIFTPSVHLLDSIYYDIDHKCHYTCNADIKGWNTVKRLCDAGARVAICATYSSDSDMDRLFPEHKGRGITFRYMVERAPGYNKAPYEFVSDCLNKDFMKDMKDGDVVLLENIWFNHSAEDSANDENFAQELARGYDMFVYNLVYAVMWNKGRGYASIDGVEKLLSSYAGYDLVGYSNAMVQIVSEMKKSPRRRRYGPSGKPRSFGIVPDLDAEYPDLVNPTVRRRRSR